jgi:hypothetical protein
MSLAVICSLGLVKHHSGQLATNRLSISLLSPEAMRKAVHGRGDHADELLTQELFCRHLLFLGGVPRPCTQYEEQCRLWHVANSQKDVGATKQKYDAIFTSKFNEFFSGVYMQTPRERGEKVGLTLRGLIWLAAYPTLFVGES